MSARSCLPLLALLVFAPVVRSQDAAEVAFRARYAAAEAELIRRYADNRRAVIEVTDYDRDPPTGARRGTGRVEVVSDRGRLRAGGVQRWLDPADVVRWGVLWSGDAAVTVSGEAGSRAVQAVRGAGRAHTIEERLSAAHLYLPLSSGWNGWRMRAVFDRCDYLRARGQPTSVRAEDAQLPDGRAVVRVTFDAGNGVAGGCLLDPANHLAFLRSEPLPGGFSTAVEYGPGPEGFPVPVSFRRWSVLPDGREVPVEEGRFVVYERYTPTDDDFDLSKHFGIDPGRVKWDEAPPPGAVPEKRQPPLLRRPWVWYTAGGVVAVLTALLVVRWRRRARRWWDDIPPAPSPPPAA